MYCIFSEKERKGAEREIGPDQQGTWVTGEANSVTLARVRQLTIGGWGG